MSFYLHYASLREIDIKIKDFEKKLTTFTKNRDDMKSYTSWCELLKKKNLYGQHLTMCPKNI